jgi:hypothetical protein
MAKKIYKKQDEKYYLTSLFAFGILPGLRALFRLL